MRSLLSRSTLARGDFVLRHRCVEAPDVSLLSGVVSAQSIFTCAGTKTKNWASYLQVLVSPFYMKSYLPPWTAWKTRRACPSFANLFIAKNHATNALTLAQACSPKRASPRHRPPSLHKPRSRPRLGLAQALSRPRPCSPSAQAGCAQASPQASPKPHPGLAQASPRPRASPRTRLSFHRLPGRAQASPRPRPSLPSLAQPAPGEATAGNTAA